jgi:hypothetical protein
MFPAVDLLKTLKRRGAEFAEFAYMVFLCDLSASAFQQFFPKAIRIVGNLDRHCTGSLAYPPQGNRSTLTMRYVQPRMAWLAIDAVGESGWHGSVA